MLSPHEIAGLLRRAGASQFLAGGYSKQIVFIQLPLQQFKLARLHALEFFIVSISH
jgi:hypothetical protein